MSFMKTGNDLVALIDMLRDMTGAATSFEEKVMVGEAEVRRHGLLTSPFETNRSKGVPLSSKLGTLKTLLIHDNRIRSFALNKNLPLRRNLR